MAETISLSIGEKPYTADWGTVKFAGNARVVAKEIESIGSEVTAQQMVDYAREHGDSEIHKCFEWDDGIAAERYRCKQARSIICNLKITFVDRKKEERTPFRYFVMPEKKCGTYQKTEVVVKNIDKYEVLLANAKDELQVFRNKYARLSELEEVFSAIDRL